MAELAPSGPQRALFNYCHLNRVVAGSASTTEEQNEPRVLPVASAQRQSEAPGPRRLAGGSAGATQSQVRAQSAEPGPATVRHSPPNLTFERDAFALSGAEFRKHDKRPLVTSVMASC